MQLQQQLSSAFTFSAPFAVLLVLWALLVPYFNVNPRLFPDLGSVMQAGVEGFQDGSLIGHIGASLLRVAVGTVLALVVAAATLAARPAREHGLWGVAGWGAGFVGALLIAPLAVGGEPVAAAWAVPAAWLATGALAYPLLRARR